jgi:hypothetical protein
MAGRHLTEEEIGSIVLLTMGGGEWKMDHVIRSLRDCIDLIFRSKVVKGGFAWTPIRLGLFDLSEGTGMDLMGAMVITSDIARDLNKGDPSPLHQRRFTDIKIGDYL